VFNVTGGPLSGVPMHVASCRAFLILACGSFCCSFILSARDKESSTGLHHQPADNE